MALFEKIIVWALALIAKFGYGGVLLTMALESAAIPIPSEVILPFSGFLAASGKLNLWLVVGMATVANLIGSVVIFYIGLAGGRPFAEKYGKYFLVHKDDIQKIDHWVLSYGSKAAFFSRLLPGVRTFSSLVLGAGKLRLGKFCWYTLLGSFIWNLGLTYAGFITGRKWNFLQPYFHKIELLIIAFIVVVIILFIFKHIKKGNK